MTLRSISALAACSILLAACAPSMLYTGSGRSGWMVGEIPRDARGEPVWAAIPPVPGNSQINRVVAIAVTTVPADIQEGDGGDDPMPPREQ